MASEDLGGTQILVEEGRWYTCNRLQAEPGSKVQLGRVLALKDEGVFHVGKPYLETVIVEAEVLEDTKGPKLTIFKMNSKKHYRRKTGHRQPLTKFLITKIDKQ
ncbi:ribosomal protein L21 [Coccomyxa subellipsoidea C-169]|uniref:Ribosomal protein L21 n=1 Tax=Coccomyxa subellipsoidea (strain C-169) TaxID=574566 RepID=I0YM20_COCSC|nr:ribosomal protein L21 [Coccomyxa subellipsoidea C-169]EIE19439.1 ribosomal protein L21 [Coccomyxa subellipsoidea C-169]|eukprot:XP_005643983.1 ribosomal protein L21 [Coccomyxa subellipsoidea C-169]